jgi:peptide/nickel transport system substrate-binding protein
MFRLTALVRRSTVLVAATLLAQAACKSDAPVTATEAAGGTLIITVPREAETLYPPAAGGSLDQTIVSTLFDRLADMPANLSTVGDSGFVPQLATGWKWAADSLSIAFAINPRARWHDGMPVRANDVAFTFRMYADPDAGSVSAELVSNIDSVSVADSLTAVVWYKRRTPRQFFEATYSMYVLPAHLLADIPKAELKAGAFSKAPVGSGRFRFVRWDPKQSIEVVSDTGNYRTRAKLDRVIWAISSGPAQSTVSTFAGEADFFEKLSPDNLAQAAQATNVRIVPYSQVGYSFLTFNLHAKKSAQLHPLFGDVRVRRALTMAVNRERVVRVALDSFGTVSIGPSPRALFPNPAAVKQLPYDVAHAKALLDSAGFVLPPGQMVRMKDGVPFTFDVIVPATSAPRVKVAQLLADEFKLINVTCNVRVLDGATVGSLMEGKDFDAWMGAYGVTPGLQGLPAAWGTQGIAHGRNYGGYSNPHFDALVNTALNSLQPAKASASWVAAFDEIAADAPALWLFEERSIGLLNRRVTPTKMRDDEWYAGLADWTIDPTQRIARDRRGLGDAR